jgi:hypothetical protein
MLSQTNQTSSIQQFELFQINFMASNRPPLPIYAHMVTPTRRTNTFQGGQRPSHLTKLGSSTMSLHGSETPLTKTHLFSPNVQCQSPSSNDHLLKYDIRRLRASLERKEEQISWWMEKSRNDNDKFEGKTKRRTAFICTMNMFM